MSATTPLALAPDPIPPRPRVLFVGTAFAAAAAAMGLLALVGVYVAQRADVLAGNYPGDAEVANIDDDEFESFLNKL